MSIELTRREFNKIAANSIAYAVLNPLLPICDEAKRLEKQEGEKRFFEDIDNFDPSFVPELKTNLTNFGKEFEETLSPLGFNRTIWEDTVGASVVILNRIAETYQTLKKDGAITAPNDHEYFQRPFYELGSALWAIDKVAKRYDHKRDELTKRINNYAYLNLQEWVPIAGVEDALLERDIFSISARWADMSVSNSSPVLELLSGYRKKENGKVKFYDPEETPGYYLGLGRIVRYFLPEWPFPVGLSSFSGIQTGERLKKRLDETIVSGGTEKQEQMILSILRKHHLSRLVSTTIIDNIPERSKTREYGLFNPPTRKVTLDKNIFNYSAVAEYVTLHEAIHALDAMLNRADGRYGRVLRLRLNRVLDNLRPYWNPKKLFAPEEFLPHREIDKNGKINDEHRAFNLNIIDEATLTNYASRTYGESGVVRAYGEKSSSDIGVKLYQASLSLLSSIAEFRNNKGSFEIIYDFFSPSIDDYRILRSSGFGGFSDFFDAFLSFRQPFANSETTELEQMIIYELKRLQIGKRGDLKPGGIWFNKLSGTELPLSLANLAKNSPEKLFNAILKTNETADGFHRLKVKQALDIFRSWAIYISEAADIELLADTAAHAMRMDEEGVIVDPKVRPILEEEKQVIEDIISFLEQKGMAANIGVRFNA